MRKKIGKVVEQNLVGVQKKKKKKEKEKEKLEEKKKKSGEGKAILPRSPLPPP